jgi:hypothetical protein
VSGGALSNLIDPAILFFFLGLGVAAVRSNLEIPPQIAKFLSLYLLMAIGFKGGQALGDGGFSAGLLRALLAAAILAVAIPAWSFLVLRRRIQPFDAAAIAATYGSVSAVTFIAASQFVASRDVEVTGVMTVALVVMESPAIVMAVLLASYVRSRRRAVAVTTAARRSGPQDEGDGSTGPAEPLSMKEVLHEAFTDGAHLLLIGSLVIGLVSGDKGGEAMEPFVSGVFKGFLAFFLLEMGLLVARQLREVRDIGPFLIGFGLVMPPIHALVAIGLARLLGIADGDAVLLAVLAASASYIVVPAVVRYAIPEARPSRYFTMALAVTFPFNIVVGIPLYTAIVQRLWP